MDDIGQLILALVRGMGVLALLTLAHGFVLRTLSAVVTKGVAVGIVFGLGAIFTMFDPFVLHPGVILDARGIILVLAAPFGGPTAAIVAGAAAGAFRFWLGGAGAPLGIIVILTAAATGLVLGPILSKRSGGYDLGPLLLLAVAGSGQSMLLLLLPVFVPGIDPWRMIAPHLVTNCIGILILGHFLSADGRRQHAHRLAESQAATDPLTGVGNRRIFERTASIVFSRHEPTALLLVDIDNFKLVNDRWGHDVGDRILRQVANAIQAAVPKNGVVARYGGEEMIVLLPGANAKDATAVAEHIRRIVDDDVFYISRTVGNVTVSVGAFVSKRPNSFEEAFVLADKALYQAKDAGRNRVELYVADTRENAPMDHGRRTIVTA